MFSSRKSSAPASGGLLSKSLRFRSSASAYLSRTPSGAGSSTSFTYSFWVKRGTLGIQQNFYHSGGSNSNGFIGFNADNTLSCMVFNSPSANYIWNSTMVFRDPSAWYNIVIKGFASSSGNSYGGVELALYVNGVQQTFTGSAYGSPTTTNRLTDATAKQIGADTTNALYYDGYLADIYYIDGQSLTPSSFGATNATTGQWSPAIYSGSYGTNGFHLTFANTTSTTTLGYDTSGNSNNWTTNNISLTAGSTYDSMNDVPVAYSATAANYAVLNPLKLTANGTLSDGNLTFTNTSGSNNRSAVSTIAYPTGSWYCEITAGANAVTGNVIIGISQVTENLSTDFVGSTSTSYSYSCNGNKINNSSQTAYGSTYTTGDVIGIAFNATTGSLTFYKNNTSQGVAFSSISGTYVVTVSCWGTAVVYSNFGQQPFTYTPPSGYNALNTYNLPTPTIAQGNKYFDISLWTGNGSTQSITNAGAFQPDLVWGKDRSTALNNRLFDAVRGVSKALYSNTTTAETTESGVTAFNSNGFTLGSDQGLNFASDSYVAWQWKANGSGSSNTNGQITSTVSVSTASGFSIVTFTTDGTTKTVGHGLGITPSIIITKQRSGTSAWFTYTTLDGGVNKYLSLNTTDAAATVSYTAPTSSVFQFNSTNGATYVAYCFAPIAGFSAFGSYTGNGSTDGPFVYCGFRPSYIMVKRSSSAGTNWQVLDTKRSTYNVMADYLYASQANNEGYDTTVGIDSLSNGFKIRGADGNINTNSATYIYMAFAENPFQYANAR